MGVGTNGVGLGPGRADGDTRGAGVRAATRGEGRGAGTGPVVRPAGNGGAVGASTRAEEGGTPKMGGMPDLDRGRAGTAG